MGVRLSDYEDTVRQAKSPLIQTQYRQAIRGFVGGLWTQSQIFDTFIGSNAPAENAYAKQARSLRYDEEVQANGVAFGGRFFLPYFGNLGYQKPLLPFLDADPRGDGYDQIAVSSQKGRQTQSRTSMVTPVFGFPLMGAGNILSGRFPQVQTKQDGFASTSPLAADSDLDGMDDFSEVFHGLNPILGDYAFESSDNNPVSDASKYAGIDKISKAYAANLSSGTFITGVTFTVIEPELENPFRNAPLLGGTVTGYDYYTYPWLAGVPFADPDGDGLLNAEEVVNPAFTQKNYGTDPSALWMTDPSNANGFVARFYSLLSMNTKNMAKIVTNPVPDMDKDAAENAQEQLLVTYFGTQAFPYVYSQAKGASSDDLPEEVDAAVLPFEVNEGFDTDGDGIADATELTNATIFKGDPQSLMTPDRQQSAYFGGAGVMQSKADTQFGPNALRTFTLECWVKPNTGMTAGNVVLIDRPWRFDESKGTKDAQLRHNFVLGLQISATGEIQPFAYYTGAGSSLGGIGGAPEISPKVISSEAIKAEMWTHLAVTYDGTRLAILVNGIENNSVATSLLPGTGVLSVKNDGANDMTRFTYRKAPLVVGATPTNAWFADSATLPDDATISGTTGTVMFQSLYRGFIDEVRIWDGARTADEIAANRSRELTQAELLKIRYEVFAARFAGDGIFEQKVPAMLLVNYTFNDLLAGSKAAAAGGTATAADTPWEIYPGEKLIGDEKKAGSFLARRKGLLNGRPASQEVAASKRPTGAVTPAPAQDPVTELFTSYAARLPIGLRSTLFTELEYLPVAHNTIGHLPLPDVERVSYNPMPGADGAAAAHVNHLFLPLSLRNGSPMLNLPSGKVDGLKVADSVYWTPYAAGEKVSATPVYAVKTTGNPYGERYETVISFDALNYTEHPAYTMRTSTDLILFGDVFSKYDFESWNNSPSTDPAAGSDDAVKNKPKDSDWFDYKERESDINKDQESSGGSWLDENVANGSTTDTDGDGMPNWWENYNTLDPKSPIGKDGPHGDPDGDFLTNFAEYLARANPVKYSTLGNGIPDYQVPIWNTRGRPTLGLLYTDNDFMEDHWEASNRVEQLSVDRNDAALDPDGDGWSNYAEARVTFRGQHSTNPNALTTQTAVGVDPAYPTPILRLRVDYFEDLAIVTNAQNNIVVQSYTVANNNSAPDATFLLPMAATAAVEGTTRQVIGRPALNQRADGFLEPGNIKPGSISIRTFRYVPISGGDNGGMTEGKTQFMRDNNAGKLIAFIGHANPEGGQVLREEEVGTINYETGEYSFFFSSKVWGGTFISGGTFDECLLRATYNYTLKAGFPASYTMATPSAGHLREGINNFFVFMDLNGDGQWNEGEPAGVPDQHDVDIGWHKLDQVLHVTLTKRAPPGTLRVDVKSILEKLMMANDAGGGAGAGGAGDVGGGAAGATGSGIFNSAGKELDPVDFPPLLAYTLKIYQYKSILNNGLGPEEKTPSMLFSKPYNILKPALTEDEILSALPKGLAAGFSENVVGAVYRVFFVPASSENVTIDQLDKFNIAVVTNAFTKLDIANTKLNSTLGGAQYHNSELSFEWIANTQVPTFDLRITQTEDAFGKPTSSEVWRGTLRGVAASGAVSGVGEMGMNRYRYTLPHGIGELNESGNALFGNGLYAYTLTLNPYNGTPYTMSSTFRIKMTDSADEKMVKPSSEHYVGQDSYFVRAQIRYNGTLWTDAHFGKRRLRVEAFRSASFNGNPIVATSDMLVYDPENTDLTTTVNPYVQMSKDKTIAADPATKKGAFCSTRFDVEVRGLASPEPIYLMAYFDLNSNGRRDGWEPWGYATQGANAKNGYYFDPKPLTPKNNGKEFITEFYVSDCDTDNDKLSDCWEWLQAGQPTTDFRLWCGTYSGTAGNHQQTDIWTTGVGGFAALTAYGAQLYGLEVTGVDANGAVTVKGLGDAATTAELLQILSLNDAATLAKAGYTSYGLAIEHIAVVETAVTLTWGMSADVIDTSSAAPTKVDLTDVFSNMANLDAKYALYGKATLGDTTWKKLGDIPVRNGQPSLTLTTAQTQGCNFFKVILSAKPAETLAN
ncbi:MAG: LamG domain-containing protein [Kiritimatiellia bacterium]